MEQENQRSSIAKIGAALAKAQGKIANAKKDSMNPHFKSKYADLASIWDACRIPLSENEIAVVQAPELLDGALVLHTTLIHSSGETLSCIFPMAIAANAQPQQIGSAITYAKKYSLASMAGVAPEDDDDGNAAQSSPPSPRPPQNNAISFWDRASYKLPLANENEITSWLTSFRNGISKAPDIAALAKYQADNQDTLDTLSATVTHAISEECAARAEQLEKR